MNTVYFFLLLVAVMFLLNYPTTPQNKDELTQHWFKHAWHKSGMYGFTHQGKLGHHRH